MFEITGNHISQLNDSDLRTLIALLCEAELHSRGLPVSALTAGGDQNAPDGGIDVRVDLPPTAKIDDFIPRARTGFQVKVPDMSRGAIEKEMRPGGVLRPVIEDLAATSGAYIIVSSKGSATDKVLRERHQAMRVAASTSPNAGSLFVGFYDRERVATWVHQYPSIIAWVRQKIGQPHQGWRPYENWANPREDDNAEYLFDEKERIRTPQYKIDGRLTVKKGIEQIRKVLAPPGGIVRLVGLSGTGKTRLVQALFDQRIGDNALGKTLAIYADLAKEPDPPAGELLLHLINSKRDAIVILDNCRPLSHRELSEICMRQTNRTVSLISVEYDVDEDEPEETEVFYLEPSSDEVIERLLEGYPSKLSRVNRHQIAEFSGGNARVALALARTVKRGESIANLTDKELFERLFHQRHALDDGIMRAAEVCSLVYSFDGETLDGSEAELPILAGLANMTAEQLFRHIADLRSRDLVQQRSIWRALLPHALANRLARVGLERIPLAKIGSIFLQQAPKRLLNSFSRRLGYLHDCEEAKKIVQNWMSPKGFLANLDHLLPLHVVMFANIASVDPDSTLDVIERSVKGPNWKVICNISNQHRDTWISLLRCLAYDARLFLRAATLLAYFASEENPDKNNGSARDSFKQLFYIQLSGTHATSQQRLQIIEYLIKWEKVFGQYLAIDALTAMLETENFTYPYDPVFGARVRDYGWSPSTQEDVSSWFDLAITYIQNLSMSNSLLAVQAKSVLANNFRGLWALEHAAGQLWPKILEIAREGFWPEGWFFVREAIRYDLKQIPEELHHKLIELELFLRPKTLLDKLQVLLAEYRDVFYNLSEESLKESKDTEDDERRSTEEVEILGSEVARDQDTLNTIIGELVCSNFLEGWAFGKGVALGAIDLIQIWHQFEQAFTKVSEDKRSINVMRGLLRGIADREPLIAEHILDSAVTDSVLGPWFPALQTAVEIGESGIARLKVALQSNMAHPQIYSTLSYASTTGTISPKDLHDLILTIALLPNGFKTAIDILVANFYSKNKSSTIIDEDLKQCGRELMKRLSLDLKSARLDYKLGKIVKTCFEGDDASMDARTVCRLLATSLKKDRNDVRRSKSLIASFFHAQPTIILDEFFGERSENNSLTKSWIMHFNYDSELSTGSSRHDNPIDTVPNEILFAWAQSEPHIRFMTLALIITPFIKESDTEEAQLTPKAQEILRVAPDPLAILKGYSTRFVPRVWSGSRAAIIESRRAIPRAFLSSTNPKVVEWAREQDTELEQQATKDRVYDHKYEQQRDERFED